MHLINYPHSKALMKNKGELTEMKSLLLKTEVFLSETQFVIASNEETRSELLNPKLPSMVTVLMT